MSIVLYSLNLYCFRFNNSFEAINCVQVNLENKIEVLIAKLLDSNLSILRQYQEIN